MVLSINFPLVFCYSSNLSTFINLIFYLFTLAPDILKRLSRLVESIAQQHRGRFVVDKHAVLAIKPITFCL